MSEDKQKDNVITFPRPISFDIDGLPNQPRAIVFGLQAWHRGKITGVILYLEKDTAIKAQTLAEMKAREAGQQKFYQFKLEDYPVY